MFESSNYRPGEPLRSWLNGEEVTRYDAELIVQKSGSADSLRKLFSGGSLDDADLIAFGRLNSWCVLQWYEPIVILVSKPTAAAKVVKFLSENVRSIAME